MPSDGLGTIRVDNVKKVGLLRQIIKQPCEQNIGFIFNWISKNLHISSFLVISRLLGNTGHIGSETWPPFKLSQVGDLRAIIAFLFYVSIILYKKLQRNKLHVYSIATSAFNFILFFQHVSSSCNLKKQKTYNMCLMSITTKEI